MPDEPIEITGWPVPADLANYLGTFGIAIPPGLDLQGAIDAAIDEWEQATHYFPFISAPTGDETRMYDGPQGHILDLDGGLVSFTSLTILGIPYASDQPVDAAPYPQFWLKPLNAPAKRRPFTYIDFGPMYPTFMNLFTGIYTGYIGYVPDAPKAIAVTGTFGFCTPATVPSQAKRAILQKAALIIAPELSMSISNGTISRQIYDFKFQYGSGATGPLSQQIDLWTRGFDQAIATFARIRM